MAHGGGESVAGVVGNLSVGIINGIRRTEYGVRSIVGLFLRSVVKRARFALLLLDSSSPTPFYHVKTSLQGNGWLYILRSS